METKITIHSRDSAIVSSVEGSLKKVAIVNKNQKNYLASTGFFQFRSKKILPEVLLILTKSIVLQYQLKQRCAGTILTAVPQESIKNILIPILPKSTQQKIAELVRKSHRSREQSRKLLEEAKKKVEEIIEKPFGKSQDKGEKKTGFSACFFTRLRTNFNSRIHCYIFANVLMLFYFFKYSLTEIAALAVSLQTIIVCL